ncbi:MAG: radical SAM protein [bacterium]
MTNGLPADCRLLPLSEGALLVSRTHAVFCRVPQPELQSVEALLQGNGALSEELRNNLERHGFFGDPRPAEDELPTVQLQLTNACNLKCSYCCTNSGVARDPEVSYERLLEVVDQIPVVYGGQARMAILGGEPLLVPWAVDLAEAIVERGLELTLFTNGMPLRDAALAKRVAALNLRGAEVRVSLGGPTLETCDELSGAPRFEDALAGIAQLAAAGGEAVVDLMFTPELVEDVAGSLRRLHELLPKGTRISLGVLYRSGREEGAQLFPSSATLEAALDRVTFEAGETIPVPERSPTTFRREACGCALGNHLNVRSDGALFTCFKMEERVGHLDEEGFLDTARRMQESIHPASSLPVCADCALATLCGGGCRAENLLYTADAGTPVCGPWRVRLLCELLAEDHVAALHWPVHHLLAEAYRRGIDAPESLIPKRRSDNLLEQ